MKLDVKRDQKQRDAEKAWVKAGYIGGLSMSTGTGKAIAALHCACHTPKGGKILFLAETTSRFKDINDDLEKYKKFFKVDILKDYSWTETTYQTAYKWKNKHFDMVIADEYHFAMTPIYSAFFKNNTYDKLVGLSATLKDNVKYEFEDQKDYTKKDLIDKYCPVVFTYTASESNQDGTSRDKIFFVIDHRLDSIEKNYIGGTKAKPFYQTEQAAYNYWDNQFKRALFASGDKKDFLIRNASGKRAKVLYSAQSKIDAVNKLIKAVKSKTLIFGNDLDTLYKITSNTISSRLSDKQNEQIREDFESGKINVIGSFKKLEQGANLSGLDNIIVQSYYSKTRPIIQRIGRIRVDPKKKHGYVFIFRTLGTQEMTWYDRMTEDLEGFTVIYCSDVEDAIKKYKGYTK